MKKLSSLAAFIVFFILGSLVFACSASAYLDPSAVTFIVQAVAGIAIASVAAVGFYIKKLQRKFRKKGGYEPLDSIQSLELTGELLEFDDSEFDKEADDMPINPEYEPPVIKAPAEKKDDTAANAAAEPANDFVSKLKFLWSDSRSYKKRLLISIAPLALLFFTFIFFGPFEMAMTNSNSLIFDPFTVGFTMGISAFVIFALATFILPLLRGKIFNYAASATFAVAVAGYLQGNFLNGELGALTGDAIAWHDMKSTMMINLVIWAVIFLIPFILAFFNIKVWKLSVQFVSIVLIAAQVVGIISLFFTPKISDPSYLKDESDYYFSEEGLHTFSPDHNVFVFLLDRMDYLAIAEVLERNPRFFDKLDGFTSYTNAISEFARTLPGASHVLTGYEENVYIDKAEDFLDKSWSHTGKNILDVIKNAGYDVKLYSTVGTMFGTPSNFTDLVSNITSDSSTINYAQLISNMSMVSAYRYAPTALKPFFWSYSDDLNKGIYVKSTRYEIDELRFAEDIENITLDSQTKCFKYIHFNGPHQPYVLNEDGTKNEFGLITSRPEQTMGCFNILYRTFDKMKELGIYEDSEIIIVADHGEAWSDYKPVQKATTIGLFHKPSGSANTPLVKSSAPVSHKNIPATILKAMNVQNYSEFGTPLDEVDENAEITRYFYKSVMDKEITHEAKIYKYEIVGDANDFKNWKIIEEYDVVDYFY